MKTNDGLYYSKTCCHIILDQRNLLSLHKHSLGQLLMCQSLPFLTIPMVLPWFNHHHIFQPKATKDQLLGHSLTCWV